MSDSTGMVAGDLVIERGLDGVTVEEIAILRIAVERRRTDEPG